MMSWRQVHVGVVGFGAMLLASGVLGASTASAFPITVASCSAEAVSILGMPLVAANPQQTPCNGASASFGSYSSLLPPEPEGPAELGYISMAGADSSTLTDGLGTDNLARVYMPRFGLQSSLLTISATGIYSSAISGSDYQECSNPYWSAGSSIASLDINGVQYDGNQSQTVSLPGGGIVAIDQTQAGPGSATSSALDITLPLLGESIVVGQTEAGIVSCS